MINDIKNNTISEANAKKKINKLNEIKNVETKGKRLIDGQKILLKLLDDLVVAILNNDNNNNDDDDDDDESNSKNVNENESKNESEYENESENENEKDEYYYEMRQLNN